MTIELRQARIISITLAVRRLRRFIPIPLMKPQAVTTATVMAVIAACGVATWAGFVLHELGVTTSTAGGAVILIGLIAGAGSGAVWGEIRAGLVETSSWWFYADRGVSPRTFIVGRHLVGRLVRLATGGCVMLTVLIVLAIKSDHGTGLDGAGWSAAVFTGAGAAACGLSFAMLRATPPLRRRGRAVATTLTIAGFTVCAVTWVWQWAVSVVEQLRKGATLSVQIAIPATTTEALVIASLVAVAVAIFSYVTLGGLSWAYVNERAEGIGRAASHRASRSGSRRRLAELMLLDVRRALRSFEWRVRPGLFTMLAMILSIVVLGALASWQFRGVIVDFSGSAVGATLVGGICAGYAFVVFSSLAPLVSLDSDRRAATLMRTLPGGIRAMAAVRAWTGSIVTAVAGATFVLVLASFAPIAPRSIGTGAVACLAVAVVAPVASAFVSLRHPQANWKEAAELGQRGWSRAFANYGAGIAIALALSTASGAPWTYSQSIAAVALLVFGSPLAAAGITALLPTTIGTSFRARH